MSDAMIFLLALFVIVILKTSVNSEQVSCDKNVPQQGVIGDWVNSSFSSNNETFTECTFDFTLALSNALENFSDIRDARITVLLQVSNTSNTRKPLTFTIRQQNEHYKIVKLPYTYEDEPFSYNVQSNVNKESGFPKWYYTAGGTLCLDRICDNRMTNEDVCSSNTRLFIAVGTSLRTDSIQFSMLVNVYPGLTIKLSHRGEFENAISTDVLSPTVSAFYRYIFPPGNVQNVTVIIRAENENPPCTLISIQDPFCPMQDVQEALQLGDSYLQRAHAMIGLSVKHVSQGETTVRTDSYNGGFAIVIVVLNDDDRCKSTSMRTHSSLSPRYAKLNISIVPAYWDKTQQNRWATWFVPFLAIIIGVFIIMLFWIYFLACEREERIPKWAEGQRQEPTRIEDLNLIIVQDLILSDCAMTEEEENRQHEFFLETIVSNSHYFLGLFCVIVFRILTITKTMDLTNCFYNKLCSYRIEFSLLPPLSFKFFMWNAVVSSWSFTVYGVLYFIFIALVRNKRWPARTTPNPAAVPLIQQNQNPDQVVIVNPNPIPAVGNEFGIPLCYHIDLALAGLLILEGVMSDMYHICPNAESYQIDAPFMDLILILAWIKLQRLRFPKYMTTGWTTFIAVLNIFCELFLLLGHYSHEMHHYGFMIIVFMRLLYFNIQVLFHCFYNYYLERFRVYEQIDGIETTRSVLNIKEMFCLWQKRWSCATFSWKDLIIPNRITHLIINVLFLVGNTTAIWYPFARYYTYNDEHSDFSLYIIRVTEINILVGIALHFMRKFIRNEGFYLSTDLLPLVFYALNLVFFGLQWKYESTNVFDWSGTQAESRDLNQDCLDGVYDAHDYYHFFKATDLFLLCMTLTVINDGLAHFQRKHIKVF